MNCFTRRAVACVALVVPSLGMAETFSLSTIFSFNGADGKWPQASVVMDAAGDLFGIAHGGGSGDHGTVFEIAAGTLNESTLYTFTGNGVYGSASASLIIDSNGNLYGTTNGGANNAGTVFEIAASNYAYSTLYTFAGGTDGNEPGDLIRDSAGNLYGATIVGGANNQGAVFEIAAGTNAESILYSFGSSATDGYSPSTGLVRDSAGNLYGTTGGGGLNHNGTVFEISGGVETILHSFNGTDGNNPNGSLVMDSAGNLYGTTTSGGIYGAGTVFEIAAGTHVETTLYTFTGGADGANPNAGLVMDSAGNLFGTTYQGGAYAYGTVFEIAAGTHAESTIYTFTNGVDGGNPDAPLMYAGGNLYGTTQGEGAYGNYGTVFELSPNVVPETSSLLLAAMGMVVFAVPCVRRARGELKRGQRTRRSFTTTK